MATRCSTGFHIRDFRTYSCWDSALFADPQSITIAGTPVSLPRVGNDENSATYKSSDGNTEFLISHQETRQGRIRHEIRVSQRKIAADPLTAENAEFTQTVYAVIDAPEVGFSATEKRNLALALFAWATSANLDKVVGREI